jgi:chromosome segregation ATPase
MLRRLRERFQRHEEPGTTESEDPPMQTTPEMTTAAIAPSDAPIEAPAEEKGPRDTDAELWAEYQSNALQIASVERELRDVRARIAATAAEPLDDGDDLEALTDRLVAERTILARLEVRLDLLRRRGERLGDQVHGLRVRGRIRAQQQLRLEIAAFEREREAIHAEAREHHAALDALAEKDDQVTSRIAPRDRQIQELALSHNKRVDAIDLSVASLEDPPPGALLKPSVWRGFLEAARAANRSGLLWIVVDEVKGEIVRSSLE